MISSTTSRRLPSCVAFRSYPHQAGVLHEKVMVKDPVLSVKFVSHTPKDSVPPGAFKTLPNLTLFCICLHGMLRKNVLLC
jgi:hypothetical protein